MPIQRGVRAGILGVLGVLFFLPAVFAQTVVDSDRDGISDEREQVLLEKFRPEFMTSMNDCAVTPARFQPDQANPEFVAHDGSIYGQVFPAPESTRVEIHYYVLWDQDCGRVSHPLDVEHVSVLVSGADKDAKALYWYAGAHEDTMCDISSGAKAEALAAEEHGPRVWTSQGKHALYLRKAMCGHGCGADTCEPASKLVPNGNVINVGEPGAPANGSMWTSSAQWRFADKMDSDFAATLLAQLDATTGEDVITVRGNSAVRGTIQGSDTVLGALGTGAGHTGSALNTADKHTSTSLGTATKATGRSLKRAWKAVFGSRKTETTKAQ